ncbi:ParB/Srx family N-terminal domain-containing protein [Cupriavidus sp. AU9028]|uniref:ParB/Srx family N-terminal domain-containing protein n=1 Tax=Cupriavidus sp. AU9028 TaxID=2871157 RepID=UPI001C94C82E|nr:ParB/Srx family N-terminal domain-containing protein [Cupriavidus sp. AU9028]MBY4898535.1 ParB/Srx family N-terminal domain-containing protein [Cupriavidus sp. AU9028]
MPTAARAGEGKLRGQEQGPGGVLSGNAWRKGARVTLPLAQLHPTQMTVGLHHVHSKMATTARHQGRKQIELLDRHRLHVVIGPGPAFYVIDHHHWARAWHDLGIESVPVVIKHNWSRLPPDRFWLEMEARHLVHPYDEYGERQALAALPHSIGDMRDDPYRSLEAFAQLAGGYEKVKQAYPDFRWADFFRRHIDGPLDTVADFALALALAVKLARSGKARGLPGWIGEDDRRGDGKRTKKGRSEKTAGGKASGKKRKDDGKSRGARLATLTRTQMAAADKPAKAAAGKGK